MESAPFGEFFSAFRAGDGDFPLPPGNTHRLMAAGAGIVAMLPVQQPEESGVFLISAVGLPGKTAGNDPNHNDIGQDRQQKSQQGPGQKQRYQCQNHTGPQQKPV